MKKKGFLKYNFNGDVVYIPIDDKHKAIPNSCWGDNWIEKKVTDETELQWHRVHEQFEAITDEARAEQNRINANKREPSKLPGAQAEADLMWSSHPDWTKSEVARRLNSKGYGSVQYLSRKLNKPSIQK